MYSVFLSSKSDSWTVNEKLIPENIHSQFDRR